MIKTENKVLYIAARKSKLLGLREMTGVCIHTCEDFSGMPFQSGKIKALTISNDWFCFTRINRVVRVFF